MRCRTRLRAGDWEWIPHSIEQDQHDPDSVSIGDTEKAVDSAKISFGVRLPDQIVQEDPHGIEANGSGPPRLCRIPGFGFFDRPAVSWRSRRLALGAPATSDWDNGEKANHGGEPSRSHSIVSTLATIKHE
jgi:hypothetical protein